MAKTYSEHLGNVAFASPVILGTGDALLVVDMQIDFMPGGALPVNEGNHIIAGVNRLIEIFTTAELPIIFTQDWHPREHASFASAHAGKRPYDAYQGAGIGPVLWPDHCVPGTPGAEFHGEVKTDLAQAIIRKGYHLQIDSYSGFLENDRRTETGLDGYLRARKVFRLFLCGLAMDYCVFFTAQDGADKGYSVFCLLDLTRPVGAPEGSISGALDALARSGVAFLTSAQVLAP
jgi:nicotinamidase/pyrazinamidase